jgi:hypothetical protein
VFHLGDVFVNGIDTRKAEETITRFVKAFFGDTKCSPNKDEYGLYIAAAAALRSADLSRQVGAAIFSSNGEIISLGCNEVPKASGGTYWTDDDPPIFRDVDIGVDANEDRKREILCDLIVRMKKEGFLSNLVTRLEFPADLITRTPMHTGLTTLTRMCPHTRMPTGPTTLTRTLGMADDTGYVGDANPATLWTIFSRARSKTRPASLLVAAGKGLASPDVCC